MLIRLAFILSMSWAYQELVTNAFLSWRDGEQQSEVFVEKNHQPAKNRPGIRPLRGGPLYSL